MQKGAALFRSNLVTVFMTVNAVFMCANNWILWGSLEQNRNRRCCPSTSKRQRKLFILLHILNWILWNLVHACNDDIPIRDSKSPVWRCFQGFWPWDWMVVTFQTALESWRLTLCVVIHSLSRLQCILKSVAQFWSNCCCFLMLF